MLTIYGSMLCPDCVQCKKDLDAAGIAYKYLDFAESLANLKAFLKLRDTHPVFGEVKQDGYIGIPCIVDDDGEVSLDWSKYVCQDNA